MYGLYLRSVMEYIISKHGEERWQNILKATGLKLSDINVHEEYSDRLLPIFRRASVQVPYIKLKMEGVQYWIVP